MKISLFSFLYPDVSFLYFRGQINITIMKADQLDQLERASAPKQKKEENHVPDTIS